MKLNAKIPQGSLEDKWSNYIKAAKIAVDQEKMNQFVLENNLIQTLNHYKMGMPSSKTIWDDEATKAIKKALRTQQGVILLDEKKMTIKTSAGDVKCYRTVADNGMVTQVDYHFMHKGDEISICCQAFSEDYKASNLTRYDSYAKNIVLTK